MRLLFWIALIILVVAAVRAQLRRSIKAAAARAADEARAAAAAEAGRAPAPEIEAEAMTRCAHCHLYFPVSEAIHVNGLDYCSPEHVGLPAR